MNILYFFSNQASPKDDEFVTARRYDAVYLDSAAERVGLAACLGALKKGDVLHIAREVHLGDNIIDVVEILADLARRDIDVHLGRTGTTLHAGSSPYLTLTAAAVRAYTTFFNSMNKHRTVQGISRAMAKRTSWGKLRLALPENFAEVVRDWQDGKLGTQAAAVRCGMAPSTFFRRARMETSA